MKSYKGHPKGISSPILAEVSYNKSFFNRYGKIYVSQEASSCPMGFSGLITGNGLSKECSKPTVVLDKNIINEISEGTFVTLNQDGTVSVVWDYKSSSNTIFPTPACDCRCVMCPQPPTYDDGTSFNFAMKLLDRLDPSKVTKICVTGGEPTLLGDKFIELMKKIKRRFDHAFVMLLTNGKNFSNYALAKEYAAIGLSNSITCFSLHSDLEELNDYIAGSKGSFHKTVQGLYNFARLSQKVEIRHVICKDNSLRLEEFAHFVHRNFPFAFHVAFMGMEFVGHALDNFNDLWIDIFKRRKHINRAVSTLHRANVSVSVYNIPLCLLDPNTWPFARQSISDWKNSYLHECIGCKQQSNCCGFFTTSYDKVSPNIKKIL